MKPGLSIHNGAPQRAWWVAIATSIGRVLSLLALRAAGAPGGEGMVLGEEVETMLVDVVSKSTRLAKHGIVHEMVVSIAQLSIRGEVRDRRIPTC